MYLNEIHHQPPPLHKAIVYIQVKLPPLIPPWKWGEPEKLVPSPFQGGGLGGGNLRNNGDSITSVYTVASLVGRG